MMILTDTQPEQPYIDNDIITQLMRIREVECQMCHAKETAMLEQLERKGWLVCRTLVLCPKDRF